MYRRIILSLILPFCLLTILYSVIAETAVQALNVSGPITTDTTWTLAESPYVVSSGFEIQEGVTLTVEPGVIISVEEDLVFQVRGNLVAVGTPQQPITFTSMNSTEKWAALSFDSRSGAYLKNVTIEHIVYGIGVNHHLSSEFVTIEDSMIRDVGFGLTDNYPVIETNLKSINRFVMTNTQFVDNAINRIHLTRWSETHQFEENTILKSYPGLEGYEVYGYVNQSVLIPAGITVTLEPGVQMMFEQLRWLDVEGHLEAIGTPTQPITFTSSNSEPWFGIGIGKNGAVGSANFNHILVSESLFGVDIHHQAGGDDEVVYIQNSVIENNEQAMQINPISMSRVFITNTQFLNNTSNRIEIYRFDGVSQFTNDVTLSPHSGLDGYFLTPVYPLGNSTPDILVPEGITLTLLPGTQMMIDEDTYLGVEGHLEAIGSLTEPITFTAATSSTWHSVHIGHDSSGSTNLTHTVLEKSEFGLNVLSGTAMINHSTFISNSIGISAEGGMVTAVCTQFHNNQTAGIQIPDSASPTISITQSVFEGNGVGAWNSGDTAVSAINNWWGSAAGPQIGTDVIGDVTVDPWLLWEPDCISSVHEIYLPLVIRP